MRQVVLLVFLFLLVINYRYLNLGFLSLYSIDEYFFHGSLLNMRDGLIMIDLKKFFSYGFYSYGFLFWLLNFFFGFAFFDYRKQ